jgi:hypothetical protein
MTNTLRYVLPVVSAIAAIAGITGYLHVRDERARRGDDLRMALRKLDEPGSQPTVDPPYRRRSIPPAAAAGTSPASPNTVPRFDAIIGQERPDVEWQRQLSDAVTAAFAADGDVRVTSATCGASLCRLALALGPAQEQVDCRKAGGDRQGDRNVIYGLDGRRGRDQAQVRGTVGGDGRTDEAALGGR